MVAFLATMASRLVLVIGDLYIPDRAIVSFQAHPKWHDPAKLTAAGRTSQQRY